MVLNALVDSFLPQPEKSVGLKGLKFQLSRLTSSANANGPATKLRWASIRLQTACFWLLRFYFLDRPQRLIESETQQECLLIDCGLPTNMYLVTLVGLYPVFFFCNLDFDLMTSIYKLDLDILKI